MVFSLEKKTLRIQTVDLHVRRHETQGPASDVIAGAEAHKHEIEKATTRM